MPKIIEPEKYEEDEEDEDEDEDDLEEPVQAPVRRPERGKPKKQLPPLPKQAVKQKTAVPTVRYTAFAQQAAEGIMDGETREVIATDIWAALANIIERLERIENNIGVMQG